MDYGKLYTRKLGIIVAAVTGITVLASLGLWLLFSGLFAGDKLLIVVSWAVGSATIITAMTIVIIKISYAPLKTLADAIVYAGHNTRNNHAPEADKLTIGREMVTALAMQVYDLASMSSQSNSVSDTGVSTDTSFTPTAQPNNLFIDHIALPIIGINQKQAITVVNKTACEFLGHKANEIIGKPLYDVARLSFQSNETFELWLTEKQSTTITATRTWERVRITDADGNPVKQFDLIASFSKDNTSGTETIISIFDHTEKYQHDDQETGFVALAVHELRTPLTVMKGYIEVFEDEVGPTLSPELQGFMHKMRASAEQLTAFVGNILNVARVEENQLVLKLQQNDWASVLKRAVDDLALRAGVYGKHIEVHIAENIPPVAVDQVSIHEVINNLVDNAIKYSGKADKIIISTGVNADGMIETSVQDFGIGIPAAVMPDLFQKFYRSHKSRIQIGGTGLGLFLCKALISAHGGNIWVRSKEGEGSIFTFTIAAYDSVKHERPEGEDGIMRGAHGWIKNHTLNRQ